MYTVKFYIAIGCLLPVSLSPGFYERLCPIIPLGGGIGAQAV